MQTSYPLTPEALKLGEFTKAGGLKSVGTFTSEEEVVVGRMVQRGTSDNSCERLKTGLTTKQLGIVVESNERPIDGDTTLANAFAAEKAISVAELTDGITVLVDQNVTTGDAVYARICSTKNVQTIAFDRDFENLNVIAWSVDGVNQTSITYATSHAATIAALAAAIEATQPVYTCTAATRTLTITSENADQPLFVFTVTLGANQAVDAAPVTTTAGVEGDQGVLRADSDSGKAVLVSNAKFKTSGSPGELVELSIV